MFKFLVATQWINVRCPGNYKFHLDYPMRLLELTKQECLLNHRVIYKSALLFLKEGLSLHIALIVNLLVQLVQPWNEPPHIIFSVHIIG